MRLWRKRQPESAAAAVQLRSARKAPFGMLADYVPLRDGETELYRTVREAVPVLDAAIHKIIRLTGGVTVRCEDPEAERGLREFLRTVPAGRGQYGVNAFLESYLDSMLVCGRAVGEIVPEPGARGIAALLCASVADVEVREGESGVDFALRARDELGQMVELPYQELLLFTPMNPEAEHPYGVSILRSLPFLTDILTKIYHTIGVNWERCGAVRYAVTCWDGGDGQAGFRAETLAREWADAMRDAQSGAVRDFVAVGDVDIRVIGADSPILESEVPVRQILEQLVDFTRDGQPWLGILKLNYKNGYTHYTESVDGAPVNSIIQQRACLPTQSGKVEEGALVDLTDYSMKLLEKKFDIDGHKEFYLSTVVFQYTTAEPEKKKLQAIQDAAVQAVQENYQDEPHVEAQVAMLIANQAADNDNKVTVEQVRRQLAEEYPLAAVPFDDYVEKSDVLEPAQAQQPVTVSPARIRRMESRSIHTASGIEVKIPTEILSEDSAVEFLHAEDGSVSLLIKNVIL